MDPVGTIDTAPQGLRSESQGVVPSHFQVHDWVQTCADPPIRFRLYNHYYQSSCRHRLQSRRRRLPGPQLPSSGNPI